MINRENLIKYISLIYCIYTFKTHALKIAIKEKAPKNKSSKIYVLPLLKNLNVGVATSDTSL
jgi:hypothetical protein